MDWITDITMRLATETKLDPADLLVDADDKDTLLDLAGILCHVLGRAIARGATLEECALVIGEFAGEK
jgi:hypothetical protein